MTLENYISFLLRERDCVIVPGFGAFMAKMFGAELNPATQMFVPPTRKISFQPQLRTDDGMLRQHIARKAGSSEDVIRLQISDLVSHWHRLLHRGEKLRLDGLGLMYIDRQGELQFSPQIDNNHSIQHFGLGVFRASPIIEVREEAKVIPLNERTDRKRIPLWKSVAVAAGVTGLLMIGGAKSDLPLPESIATFDLFQWSQTTVATEEISHSDVETQSETSTDEVTPAPSTEVETQAEEADIPAVEITVNPVSATPVTKGSYYVIVGSFVEKANADDLHRELEQKGFDPVILPFDGRFNKVAVASFTTRSEAIQALRNYKNDVQRGAWIYHK